MQLHHFGNKSINMEYRNKIYQLVSKIPCHGVVFADGSLSKNYAFGGLKKQKEKLEKEGVIFKGNKVNLKICQYFK